MRSLAAVLVLVACGGSPKPPQPQVIGNTAKPAEDPQLARQQAIDEARAAGILGVLSCDGYGGDAYGGGAYGGSTYGCGGAIAALTGTGDFGAALDDATVYGGLIGNEAGAYGGFGYGGLASGDGGGAVGVGTIGTGTYGTIGHGSGTGSGYGVGGGRANALKVRYGKPTTKGQLDKEIIRRYIRRELQKITACYEDALANAPDLAGTVTCNFTIDASGVVTSSTATGVDPDVADCIAGVIQAIAFPKPKSGKVTVVYPFTLAPSAD